MYLNFFEALIYLSIISVLIPTLVLFYKRGFDRERILLLTYLISGLITEVVSLYFVKVMHVSNGAVFHAFTIIEISLVGTVYLYEFGIAQKHLFLGLIVLVRLLCLPLPDLLETQIFAIISSVVLLTASVYYFYGIFDRLDIPILTQHWFFYINSAVIFYFGISFVYWTFFNQIQTSPIVVYKFLWSIKLCSNIIYHLILAKGLWIVPRR